ncbi:MAG: ROK family protein, partial [Fimbriimonadaceae bacterium]|nr:ROK family protein [Fimbriimonadaceae bacterium]
MSAAQTVIGVDLGGTNVRAQVFFEDGSPAGQRIQIPSQAQHGREAVVEAIVTAVRLARSTVEAAPVRIGMAIPGHIDDARGVVKWSPNFGRTVDGVFHSWRDVEIREEIEELTGLPLSM